MSISTAKEFIAALAKSRLLKPKHLDAVRSAAEKDPDPKALAGRLVKKELLSRWQAKQLLAGHTSFFLGAYRLLEPLSRHSGSHVYLAEHKTLGRRVVLKRLPRDVTGDEDRKKRLLGAVRALVGLDHENLARVYSIEQAGDRYYVISQYVEGRDLADTVAENGPLSFADTVAAVSQAAAGLAEAHRRKAVHGGVRPSNLVLTPEGHLKLVGAGTARRYHEAASESDEPDTPAALDAVRYQAPELLKPDADPTPASDIYSLGCTLYFLLTGKPPFAEGTAAEMAQGHARHQPPGILRARSDTPDLLVKACRKMLSKRPEDRPGTAEEVVEMLAELSLPKRSAARIVATVSAGVPQGGAPAKGESADRNASPEKPKPGAEQAGRPKAEANDTESDSDPASEQKPAAGNDKARPAGAPAKNGKTVPDAKSPERRQPAKTAPAAAKPAPKRKPARNAKEQDEATSPAKASGRKAKPSKSEAAFAVDAGDETSPTARAKSRAGKGKSGAETAAAGEGSQGFFRKHGKLLAIGGGSLAVLLLAAAISLPFVLGGSSAARPEPETAQAEPEQESQTQKPPRSASDDVIDDLNLEGDLDLDIDDLVGDEPPRQPPSEPEPEEQPDAGDAPEEQPPAEDEDEDEPSDPDGPSEPDEPSEPDDEGGENEPAEPEEPKETPPEKPDPPKKEKPPTFRDFPEQVVLPSPGGEDGQPAPTEPINLGKLYVRERAPWVVALRGGDTVVPNAEIVLNRDAAEGGGRAYVFELSPSSGDAAAIARLRYVPEADQLTFQWLEPAAEMSGAGLLRWCLLELNIDGETKTLALSEPKPAPPLGFDLDKKIDRATIESDELPAEKLLRLEITGVEGEVERHQTQPEEPVEARQQMALAFQRMDRDRNPQPIAIMQLSFTVSSKSLTVLRRIEQPPRRMVVPGPQLAMLRQKGEEEYKKVLAQMNKAQGHGAKDKFRPILNKIEEGLGHLDLVEKIDKQAKIHYRILLQAGSHQVPLFDSQLAGPAGAPEQ